MRRARRFACGRSELECSHPSTKLENLTLVVTAGAVSARTGGAPAPHANVQLSCTKMPAPRPGAMPTDEP